MIKIKTNRITTNKKLFDIKNQKYCQERGRPSRSHFQKKKKQKKKTRKKKEAVFHYCMKNLLPSIFATSAKTCETVEKHEEGWRRTPSISDWLICN